MTAGAANGTDAAAAPLVSILIRSMDRATLDRAIASAAAQTHPNIEIVVGAACGARHRALPDTVDGRPLRLVFAPGQATLDRPRAANLLLESARGEWLNFLDDDDELFPQHVATLLAAERTQGERVIYSRAEVRDADGRTTGHSGIGGFHAQLYFQNRSHPSATLFHRSLVHDDGLRCDPDFPVFEDRDFAVACATRTAFKFVDAVTSVWHGHVGDSGLGFSDDARKNELQDAFTPKLREKWKDVFARWLAEPAAMLFLGQHFLRAGEPAKALPYLERALRDAPRDVNALNLAGMANLRTGNAARAESLLRAALALLPDHAGLRDNLRLALDARTTR